jgi:uncharacterized caspase-like protein/Tol biopolymer transport system component
MNVFKLWCGVALLLVGASAVYAGLEQVGENLDEQTIKLLNVETGQMRRALTNHASSVDCVAFSPDGKILASGSFDKTIKLWDAATGKELATLMGHTQSVNSIAFNRDGTMLASASDDGTVKLWDIAHRSLIVTLTGHTAAVDSVAFSPKGGMLASASADKTIQLWNIETRALLKKLTGHEGQVTSIAFSPNGETLASGSIDQTVKLWNLNTGQTVKTITKENAAISAVVFSPDGKTLAVGGTNLFFWDVASGERVGELTGHSSYVKALDFSPDGKTLASGSLDSTARLWDVGTRKQLKRLVGNSFGITSVAFSPDGKTLATGSVLGSLSGSSSLYILTIGINKYVDPRSGLMYAAPDARDFADAIERAGQGLFKRINKQVLLDTDATQASIKAAFDRVIAEARPQDVFVFHYAGRDGLSQATATKPSEFYLIPQDFPVSEYQKNGNNDLLEAKAVSASVLRARLTAVMSRRQFIVLDTCSSAKAFEAFVSKVGDEQISRHHAPKPGLEINISSELKRNIMVVASEGTAYESAKLGHGLLTYALLQGLNGEANEMQRLFTPSDLTDIKRAHALATSGSGVGGIEQKFEPDMITTELLEAYVYSKVLLMGREFRNKMRPRVYAAGNDFALGYAPRTQTARTRADIIRAPEPKKEAAVRTGKDYALIFANSDYDSSSWPHLPNPHNDAVDLKEVLESQYGFAVDLLENKSKSEIEATLVKYMNEKKFADEDQLFVFFAGHGTYNEALEQGFVVAKDSKSRAEDPLNQSCIRHSDIYKLINRIQCKHILVVLDVCFGGTFGNVMRSGGGDDYRPVSKLERIQRAMKLQCRKYITSGGKEFVSDGSGRNSPFAYWLLDVLRKGGDEGVLTFDDIHKSVKKVSTSEPIGAAMPTDVPGSDFLLIAKAS